MVGLQLVELIAPSPCPERARPLPLELASDGRLLYTNGKCIYIRPLSGDGEVCQLRHSHDARVVRLSPTGDKLAVGDISGQVRILSLGDDRERVLWEGSILGGPINDLRWSTAGDRLLLAAVGEGRGRYCAALEWVGGEDGFRSSGELAGPTKACNSVAWNSSGSRIAVASDDFTVTIFAVAASAGSVSLKLLKTLRDHNRFVMAVTYGGGSSEVLATAGADGKVFIYTSDAGELLTELSLPGVSGSVTVLTWCAGEVHAGTTGGGIYRWDTVAGTGAREGKLVENFGQQVLGLQCTANYLVAALLDGSIAVLSRSVPSPKATSTKMLLGHTRTVTALLTSTETGDLVCSADAFGRIIRWQMEEMVQIKDNMGVSRLEGDFSAVDAFSSIGGCMLSMGGKDTPSRLKAIPTDFIAASACGSQHVFVKTGEIIVLSPTEGVRQTGLAPDKATCALIVPASRSAKLFYVTEEKKIKKALVDSEGRVTLCTNFTPIEGNVGKVTSMAWNELGSLLAAGDDQRRIQVYLLTENTYQVLPTKWCHHNSTVSTLAWTHGSYLLSGGLDCAIMLWNHEESKIKPLVKVCSTYDGVLQPSHWHNPFVRVDAHAAPINLVQAAKDDVIYSCAGDACIKKWKLVLP